MPRIVAYECVECGTEVVVNENLETKLRPIYCCGIRIAEIGAVAKPVEKKKAAAKAKAAKSSPKKTTASKVKKTLKPAAAKTARPKAKKPLPKAKKR
jgi:DNA-directed RNA polymerase subunit RPC12/RpoP